MSIDECRTSASGTLLDALRALDRGASGIVLVLGADGKLEGVLTDGDVRRALLSGKTLESPLLPHIRRDFVRVGPESSRAEVLDLMQALRITQVPVVNADGELLGVHFLREVLGAVERPNWGVIVAGGRGTRLDPITEVLPKPMIRVAGRPILERIVLHLVGFGIRRLFISVNYLAHVIQDHFRDGSRFGCRIEYLEETRPLGTGGALSLLPEPPRDPLIVMNGDLITQVNLGDLIEFHSRRNVAATVAVRRYYHRIPYGCIELDGDRITELEEKPALARLVNAGIYALRPDLIRRIPRDSEFPITSLVTGCIERGEDVAAFEFEDEWADVGQREELRNARGGRLPGE